MYNGTQIQDNGNRRDVTTKTNSKGRTVYCCNRCHKEFWILEKINNHIVKCKEIYNNLQEDIYFVVCNLCGWHAKKIKNHINKIHKIDINKYNGKMICKNSSVTYSKSSKKNGNWIVKAKERGDDLQWYRDKMSKSVSQSILSNLEERKRRAKVMSDVNRSDVMRKKSSETAKKTSARKDIQKQRAQQLKNWRDNNPEDFYNKCVSKMLNSWNSKPEKLLYNILYNFK